MSEDNKPKVEIYTQFGCPYCYRAIALLKSKDIDFTEYDVTMDSKKRAEMVERKPGARTVPQIFIDNEAVGGSDELAALERSGKLDPMLGL